MEMDSPEIPLPASSAQPLPRRVERLCIDDCPPGAATRLLIEIAQNGIGQSIRVPVVVARGNTPGPVFGVTAAVHGNELNGIPVIHQLLRRLDPAKLQGTVVTVIVSNLPGLLRDQREFNDGVDLNDIMPGRSDGDMSQVYAHHFIERVTMDFDFLVDLHTASFGRVNSFYVRADMSEPTTSQMARLQQPQIILHDPPSDYTLRGAAAERGIPAITVELRDPHRFQADPIRRTVIGVRRALSHVGMLPTKKVSERVEPVICQESSWIYTDCGGFLSVLPDVADRVQQGELIARQTNVFGDLIREYFAPVDGVIIGKSINPVSPTGARIVHLGIVSPLGGIDRNEINEDQFRAAKET